MLDGNVQTFNMQAVFLLHMLSSYDISNLVSWKLQLLTKLLFRLVFIYANIQIHTEVLQVPVFRGALF